MQHAADYGEANKPILSVVLASGHVEDNNAAVVILSCTVKHGTSAGKCL